MPTSPRSRKAFGAATAALLAAAAATLLSACSDQPDEVAGFVADKQAPVVLFDSSALAAAQADSALTFTVMVRDNLDLSRVQVEVLGGVQMTMDTTITGQSTTTLSLPMRVPVPSSVPAGTPVKIVARATDGARNLGVSDTLRLSVGNVPEPRAVVTSPAPASLLVNGKRTTITLVASSPLKVRVAGYRVTGPFALSDSTVFAAATERDSVVVVDTLEVPANAPAGVLTVRPFVVDGAGRVANGPAVTYAVQSVSNTDTRPVATAGFNTRIESVDTVQVNASDPVGLRNFGYEVLSRTDTTRRIAADSVTLADPSLVNDARRFTLRLDAAALAPDTLPVRVIVRAFATNAAGRRAAASINLGGSVPDTAVVVAGITTPLPTGGRLVDGFYVPRRDRLYLTNVDRNVVEQFDPATNRFLGGINVGSRPWGIAPWPGARDGTFGDTLLVANSGGTNLSYVDLAQGREVFRYSLPNIIAYSVTTVLSATNPNIAIPERTIYDFSDRPQFLATVCPAYDAGGRCDEPTVVYSTTPTPGQSLPFQNRGTVRSENLRRRSSHFFFEQAAFIQSARRSDTLEVRRFAAGGIGADSTLVPFRQYAYRAGRTDSIPYSVVFDIERLAFRDTTFVRNSANFARVIVGEGGPVQGSRAVGYDATRGMATTTALCGSAPTPYMPDTLVVDCGVSRATDVTDFIANAFARVRGVAINFDGAISAVRGDSTYLIDPTLRLQGLMQTTGGGNAGFDFHPQNVGAKSAAPTRFAFSASLAPQIEIYDTWCYQRVRTIPVREPIVGPIRATRRPAPGGGFQLTIVGASARGVIVVAVPEPIASSCP